MYRYVRTTLSAISSVTAYAYMNVNVNAYSTRSTSTTMRIPAARRISRSTFTTRLASSATTSTWQDVPLEEYQAMLSTAETAVREAGKIILTNLGCSSNANNDANANSNDVCEIKTSIKDVVTKYDKEAQDIIKNVIQTAYPEHRILGEEDVDPGAAASEKALSVALEANDGFMWIVDPIDGTANFSSGLALCGVIVSVVYKDQTVIGVCYDPHADELFSAIKGQGAFVNGDTPMYVQQSIDDISDSIINAGCPADPNAFETSMRGMLALNSKARGLRVIACTALTTAWIARGSLTAHFGYDIASWDLAAGALLIQEAGGKITDLDGSPYTLKTRNMLCSNGLVHDQVLEALREADAVEFERA